ncbi:hypothetical protein LOD99_1349 [Oopsacas minuta]|uniref:Uncharacterized protein n=1 Tax=Oopsacas minuta TaxID=111878 RepID=A0AAV7K7S7_9METZ|nr:hypothetical protein LOD99_1349 [Oopsacas minuta]
MAAEGNHINPPHVAIEDELTEIRRLLTLMVNNPATDQANIALETIVYKYHANLLQHSEVLAAREVVRLPLRPPDADLQHQQLQQLARENDELTNKLREQEENIDLLHRVNKDWENQYKRNDANHLREKQLLEKSIRELQSKIELISTIRSGDDSNPPPQEHIVQLINEKEEALNKVKELFNANNKLKKKLETQEQLIQEDEQNAEAVDKMLNELKDRYKQKEAEEAKNISEYNELMTRYNEFKDQYESAKVSEADANTKLRKSEESLKSKVDEIEKAKTDYRALQKKLILSLLGEEKVEPKKETKKKKKVRLLSRNPYGLEHYDPELLDFYQPDIDIMAHRHGSRKHRTPPLSRLSEWDLDYETLDTPRFGHRGRYYTIDSD